MLQSRDSSGSQPSEAGRVRVCAPFPQGAVHADHEDQVGQGSAGAVCVCVCVCACVCVCVCECVWALRDYATDR